MVFSDKQQAVINKASSNGYLNHVDLSPEVVAWLGTHEPKDVDEASRIISLVLAIAYGQGAVADIWSPTERRNAQRACAEELTALYHKYTF